METQQQPKKRGHTDPEFLSRMRLKAAEKKAEQKKIKEAENLKKQQEHQKKLKEADELLNPKPENESLDDDDEPEVAIEKPIKVKKEKAVSMEQPRYKDLYYKHKLEMLQRQSQSAPTSPPAPPPQPTIAPYEVALQNIKTTVNRDVMKNIFSQYFPQDRNPF